MTAVTAEITTEAELLTFLNAHAPGRPAWEADSESSLDGYELAVYTLAPADPDQVAALLAYIWQGPMAGEWWDQEPAELLPGQLFLFAVDTTKSQRDDVPDVWAVAQGILVAGTPVRRTNQAGPGTRGTRKLAGLGPVLLAWR